MKKKTNILIVSANPKDTSKLRLDEEAREIEEGLQRSQRRGQFKVKSKWALRARDLRRALLDEQPNIVHFSGHGALKASH
jgi:CHAT domain-containing protein